ncbi:MAG: fused MFS/spermidine synthase [Acidobacteria bacterium]|nr:fused MFS/spermidine synthase [Acidobacteriota bacterium]
MNAEGTPVRSLDGAGRSLVLAAVAVCGAAVMEVEVLGARMVGPWFGVSLFVWTALITVTLLSLALGYYLGGRLADARGSLRLLGGLVVLAGLLLLAVPFLRVPVLKASLQAGLRGGALLAALLLFAPCLTVLGTVTPFAVRLYIRDMRETGRTVGRLSALSTLGSFLGTVTTGFWLIPAFHVDQIASGSAFVLLLLGSTLLAWSLRMPALLLVAVPALGGFPAPPLGRATLPDGTLAELVHRRGSFYGQVSVADYRFGSRHHREMLIDGIVQGGVDATNGLSIYPNTYVMETVARQRHPAAQRALVIGLGPGLVVNRFADLGMGGTVVDIDSRVVSVARDWFGFREGPFRVEIADGRTFLGATEQRFDVVLLDAFSAEMEPANLVTREAFEGIRRLLNPGGLFLINTSAFTPGPGFENPALDSMLRTLDAVFPGAEAFFYPTRTEPGTPRGNVLVAQLPGAAAGGGASLRALPVHEFAQGGLEGLFGNRYLPAPGSGIVLTDAYAPLESMNAAYKLTWRRETLANTPPEILLN